MRSLKCLFVAAAIGGIMALPHTGSASPLASGLASGNSVLPELSEGLVQKVHGWHCRKRYGWYHHHKYWHRHYRACHRYHRSYSYYDNDYYDDDYSDDYSYPYPAYPYYKRRHHYGYDEDYGYGGY